MAQSLKELIGFYFSKVRNVGMHPDESVVEDIISNYSPLMKSVAPKLVKKFMHQVDPVDPVDNITQEYISWAGDNWSHKDE